MTVKAVVLVDLTGDAQHRLLWTDEPCMNLAHYEQDIMLLLLSLYTLSFSDTSSSGLLP